MRAKNWVLVEAVGIGWWGRMSYEEFKEVMSQYGTYTEEELLEMYEAEMRAEYDI